jgi:hypothetical protein
LPSRSGSRARSRLGSMSSFLRRARRPVPAASVCRA